MKWQTGFCIPAVGASMGGCGYHGQGAGIVIEDWPTQIDTSSNNRQKMLKFRCETLIGKESQKCLQAVQGGHQGGHQSTLVKYRHMPIPPACSSPLKTEDLLGSWPGRYMRMDSTQQHSLYGITVSPKLPPSSVLRPATSQARLHGISGPKSMYSVGQ